MATFDIAGHIGAVARVVDSCIRDGLPARMVVATCSYPTDAADLWDALTNIERIPRWFMPVSGELRLGGRYQLQGNAAGEITGCEPPSRLAITWEFGGEVSWVTVTLAADESGGTVLTLEHVAHVDDTRWDQYGPGAVGVGWDMALLGLGRHVATGESVDGKAGIAWLSTAEGRRFVSQSSDDWGRAAIAAGDEPAKAKGSAERTRAAYTGDTEPTAGA
jgi:uncharacterized protein YndB with AHSA1/START domain